MSNSDKKRGNALIFNAVLFSLAMFFGLFSTTANATPTGSDVDSDGKITFCHNTSKDSHTITTSLSSFQSHVTHHLDVDGPCLSDLYSPSCAANVSFSGLDKNLLYSLTGQDFPSQITYSGAAGNNVWSVNVRGIAAFDAISRDTRTTNGSGPSYQNPEWPSADGIWFKDVFPGEQIDYQFAYTRVSGSDPLNLYMHTGESLDDERDTLTTDGSDWILGRFGNMTENPNLSGKTAIFEDNGLTKGVDTGVGYWEAETSFTGSSGLVTWNYAYLYHTSDGTNMIAFEVAQDCAPAPQDLSCPVDYQLETWPAASPIATTFDSSNNLLRLTASTNFTNSTHPGIAGIRTSTAGGEVSETLTISSIDTSVTDILSLRVIVYDLDSETSSDQDYAYITFNGANIVANSIGSNVEPHPTITNAYTAILNSGGGSGADNSYHAGFVVDGISDGSTITMTSGYSGTGSESFVGYQACVKTSAGSVSGVVFQDVNTNDIFDSGESGLANISVWLQAINVDGSIDPVKVPANTDALGNYQINGLADGDYQVHVDSSDTDLPSDHIVGASNPLIININGSNISDADFPFDEVVCEPFVGEVSEVSIPLVGQLKTTDKLFVPSRDVATSTGHLKAYAVDANGVQGSLSWDASTLMDSTNRTAGLYSSDSGGKIKSFNSLTEISESIRQYTVDAPLGGVSRGNDLDLLTQKINISLYLKDTAYRDYYTNKVATRDQLVLMSSDDGFLYAFDYSSGALVWAWMPRSLITELTGTDSYQAKHLMAGSVDILDLPDSSGKYDTYVVGAYKKGLGHYVLKLKDDGSLDKIIWDDDQSSVYKESPNNGEMEFFRDSGDDVYAAYVLTDITAANPSRLKIRSLAEDTVDMSIILNYQATSTPFVMPDYDKRNAPAKHILYLGNSIGAIHNIAVLDGSDDLKSEAAIQAELPSASVTTMNTDPSDAVLYIDASISSTDNSYYLSTQSATRLTVHRFEYSTNSSSWKKDWTSYASGSGTWASDGTPSPESINKVPTIKDGFAVVPPDSGIQWLPANARITAKATIVGDRVVLPLTVLDSATSSCYGKAYYYLYKLSDGNFTKQSFFKMDGTAIVENIALGYGEASQLSITDVSGTNKLLGFGVADKDLDKNSGIATSFVIKDPVTTGVRGWKEIGR